MRVFYYDATFEGLLSAVFDAYTLRRFPDAMLPFGGAPSLLQTEGHEVETTPEKAGRVFRGLDKRLSSLALSHLCYAWLSEEQGADMLALRYIRKIFDCPQGKERDLADGDVFALLSLAKRVRGEQHRLLGFARFQKSAQGVYFAAVAPRHNILPLMLPHFADRFSGQPWILYDLGRRYGVLFDKGGYHEVSLDEARARRLVKNGGKLDAEDLDAAEPLIQELWKSYFEAVSIKERANRRLQLRCLPRRFWPYLTEMQ